MSDTVTDTFSFDGSKDKNDLRLILDVMHDASEKGLSDVGIGLVRLDPDVARTTVSHLFGNQASASAVVLVIPRSPSGEVFVSLDFDLSKITTDIRQQISQGIGRNRRLVDLLGGIPIEVTDRLDVARTSPKLAAHLIATASDHLVWKIRLLIQDTLAPVNEDGDILSWCGDVSMKDQRSLHRIGDVLPFATAIRVDIPASMERVNV